MTVVATILNQIVMVVAISDCNSIYSIAVKDRGTVIPGRLQNQMQSSPDYV